MVLTASHLAQATGTPDQRERNYDQIHIAKPTRPNRAAIPDYSAQAIGMLDQRERNYDQTHIAPPNRPNMAASPACLFQASASRTFNHRLVPVGNIQVSANRTADNISFRRLVSLVPAPVFEHDPRRQDAH